MFENFPTSEKVKPTHEVMRADFESKEKETIKKGTDFLENLEPEKFKKKAANWLLAFSLFAGATSAFAGEQNTDKDLPEMGEEKITQVREKSEAKNQTADFDWKKIAGKIEISMGAENENIKDSRTEIVDAWGYSTSEFYNDISTQEVSSVFQTIYQTISSSQNSNEFFANVSNSTQGFSEQQKVMMLQQFGNTLEQTYNYDMVPFDRHVAVSSDKMFQSLKDQTLYGNADKSGICGNIHTFLTLGAQNMGIESGLQSLGTDSGNHVISSLVLGSGEEKEVAFLDYGTLVRTGTLNYSDAIGRLEVYSGTVSVFNSYVGNATEVLFPVKSRAGEVVEKAMGVEGSSNRLDRNLEEGERKKKED